MYSNTKKRKLTKILGTMEFKVKTLIPVIPLIKMEHYIIRKNNIYV